ncbi:MAG: FecR domain-containing protein [Cyclobacteriaceae bacterium]
MTELLAKYFSGNISEDEKKSLLDWREENDHNAEKFFEYSSTWYHEGIVEPDHLSNNREAFRKVEAKLSLSGASSEPTERSIDFKKFMRYAASVILLAAVSYFLYNQVPQSEMIEVATSAGETNEVVLPDGSKVSMDENSIISYSSPFDDKARNVTFSGKGFFDIVKDPKREFTVLTNESKIKVLGTSFLVESNTRKQETKVVVETGKVGVSGLFSSVDQKLGAVELIPGQAGLVSAKEKITTYENTDANYLAWKTHLLDFDKSNLAYVFETLEDTYHIDIDLTEQSIANCQLSATYDHQPISSIMEILTQTFDLNLKKINDHKYQVSGTGCSPI